MNLMILLLVVIVYCRCNSLYKLTLLAYFTYTVVLLLARRTNSWKVVVSRPTKVVCITVLTGNCLG